MTNVVKSEKYIDMCIGELMSIFDTSAEKKEVIDLSVWLQRYKTLLSTDYSNQQSDLFLRLRFAFVVISELFYGAKFGSLQETQVKGSTRQRYLTLVIKWHN